MLISTVNISQQIFITVGLQTLKSSGKSNGTEQLFAHVMCATRIAFTETCLPST